MRKKSTRKRKRRPRTAITHNRTTLVLHAILLVVLTCCFTNSANLQAQRQKPANYALIFGTVWGPDDRPVYGVTVKIRAVSDKKARWEVHSNHLGEFEQAVPAGKQDYVVWADLKGYRSPAYKHLQPGAEVTVHVENDERVDTGVHLK